MGRARFCVVALVALFSAGCRKKPPPPPPITIADGGVKEEPRAYAPQILARSIAPPSIHWLDDREMVLGMGMFFHTVDDNGVITRLGKLTDYARFLPENDDDIGGYEVGMGGEASRVSGSLKRLFVTRIYPEDVHLWDGTTWSKATDAPPEYEGQARWTSSPLDQGADAGAALLPTGPSWRVFVRLKDGRALWLGESEQRTDLALIDKQGSNVKRLQPIEPQHDAKGVAGYRCQNIPSRDGTAWLDCEELDPDWGDRFKRKLHVVRLDGEELREVALPEAGHHMQRGSFAVDDEGTLWYSEQSSDRYAPELVRVPRVGPWEKLLVPTAPAELVRPSYTSENIATRPKGTADSPYRHWSVARIRSPREPAPITRYVERVVPRPNGDVLVLARDSAYANVVVRFARGATPTPTERIVVSGTAVDQRNEIRNTRPLRSWVGHCPQIFITLGKDAAKVLAREADVQAVLEKARKPKKSSPQAAIIEGKLGGAPVVGVALLRTYPDVREDDLEATASRIIERFTTDPSSPPDATCTLPVLEKVHKDYPSHAEGLDF